MKTLIILAVTLMSAMFAFSVKSITYVGNDDLMCKCCDSTCVVNDCCAGGCGSGEGSGACCTDKCVSQTCKECCSEGNCKMKEKAETNDQTESGKSMNEKACCNSSSTTGSVKCCK